MSNSNNQLLYTSVIGIFILSLVGAAYESPRYRPYIRYFFAFVFGGPRNLRRKKILDAIKFPLRGKDSKESGLSCDQLYQSFISQYLTEEEFEYVLRRNNYTRKCEGNSFEYKLWKVPRPTGEMLLEAMEPYLRELRKVHLRRSLNDSLDAWKNLKGANYQDELRYTQKSYLKMREVLQEQFDGRAAYVWLILILGALNTMLLTLIYFAVPNSLPACSIFLAGYVILLYLYPKAIRRRNRLFYQRARIGVKEFWMRERQVLSDE